jgi:hypothetical protein
VQCLQMSKERDPFGILRSYLPPLIIFWLRLHGRMSEYVFFMIFVQIFDSESPSVIICSL